MRPSVLLFAALATIGTAACGSSTTNQAPTTDSGTPVDAGDGGTTADGDAADAGPAWTKLGFDNDIVRGLAVDPKNSNLVVIGIAAGSADKGVFRTKDGGKTWTKCAGGLPDLYTSSVAISPVDGSVLANPGADGIYRSTDGGESWTQVAADPGGANGFLHHPTNKTVWTVTSQKGAYRSPDNGITWTLAPNNGLPLNTFGLGPMATDGTKLYLASEAMGVWVSTDNGDSWTKAASTGLPDGTNGGSMLNIAASTSRPDVVLVQTLAGGLYRSTDGAQTFTKLDLGAERTRYDGLRIAPSSPTTIFVSLDGTNNGSGGVARSTNDGASWEAIGPSSTQTVGVGAIDIAPDGATFVGTIGAGVWRLTK